MITPLLMIGGAYLCYEGVEKVLEAVMPHRAHQHEAQLGTVAFNTKTVEDERVASAIKTDFILSAEIMAIALAALPASSIVMQALVLALVGIGITVAVYGVVALIVKANDFGVVLANNDRASVLAGMGRASDAPWFAGCPCSLQFSPPRHSRHDLGWRRHRPAWPGSIRPAFNRLDGPRRRRNRGSRPAIGRRGARIDR